MGAYAVHSDSWEDSREIRIRSTEVENVEDFCYLGSWLSTNGNCDKDCQRDCTVAKIDKNSPRCRVLNYHRKCELSPPTVEHTPLNSMA